MSDLRSRISRLNEEQRQILEARLKEENLNFDTLAGDTELSVDSRNNPEDGCGYYPVSAVQQSMYLLNRLIGTDSCYNETFAVMVDGILNIEKLETACNRLVQRHEAMRTSFHSEHGKPVQKIHRTAAVRILMVDSYTGSMDDLILNFIQPFDLASLPLLRLMCIRLADNKHILVFDMPHIITDWESSGIFVQDLFSLYNSRPVPVPTSQNRDFALFQLELEKSELWQIQEKYWQDIYMQNIPELLLPYDFPRPPVQSFEGASVHIQLNDEIKFRFIGEQLVQVVADSVDFKLNIIDTPESEIDRVINRLILPFDLTRPPLIQCTLARTGDRRHFLIINTHHIIIDGSSIAIFMNELIDLYSGRDLLELKIQFRDFAAWHNRLLELEEIVKQRDYWLRLFSEDVPVPDLPVDCPRPAVLSFNGDYITDQLGGEILRKMKIICQDIGITLFNMLLGIYGILLSQYSGREDLVIGIPAAGRNHPDLENSTGMFINTLALRLLPARCKTVSGYLKEVHECLLQALKHQDYQFDQLIIDLGIKRDPSRTPLFNTMFVLQNAEWVERELENIEMKEYPVRGNVTQFEINDDIHFKVLYSTDLFKKDTLRELCRNFRNLVQLIINSQEILLGDINVFPGNSKPAMPVIDKEEISFNF